MRIRILLLMSSWGLMTLSAFGLSKTIDVKTAGKLSELIKAGDAVTELSITGHINKADFAYIDTALVKVEKLDLRSVTVDACVYRHVEYPANAIPDSAFMNKWELNQNHVAVYKGNATLKTIVLPASIEAIGVSAFNSIRAEKIDFSACKNLKTIERNAFEMAAMKEIDLSGLTALKDIKNNAFKQTAATSIVLDGCSALRSIGEYGFAQSYSISSMSLKGCGALASIANRCFLNLAKNSKPKSLVVDLSETALTELPESSFQSGKMTAVLFPSTLETIKAKAFNLASGLNQLTFKRADTKVESKAFATSVLEKATVKVPEGSEEHYKALGFAHVKTATAIHSIVSGNAANAKIYTIDGRRVKEMGHGLYIINGRKVVK